MLKWIFFIVIAVSVVSGAVSTYREDELQTSRNVDQRALLAQMEGINSPVISQLVDDWRKAYPEPTDKKLTELRIISQRVKNDPASAAEFTTAAKQKGADEVNSKFTNVFGSSVKADGPGL